MTTFRGERVHKTFVHTVEAPPQAVFPLLCPVRETEWIEGWSAEIVYSVSGVAEALCVFRTAFPERGRCTWVVDRYDPERWEIGFVVFCPDLYVERLAIALKAEERGTRLRWDRIYTGLCPAGNEFLMEHTGAPLEARMAAVMKALDHYCKTGEMLRAPRPHT
jgi:hypothetical protein